MNINKKDVKKWIAHHQNRKHIRQKHSRKTHLNLSQISYVRCEDSSTISLIFPGDLKTNWNWIKENIEGKCIALTYTQLQNNATATSSQGFYSTFPSKPTTFTSNNIEQWEVCSLNHESPTGGPWGPKGWQPLV